jgi:putative nucleotidyltransferase with HDIG domain
MGISDKALPAQYKDDFMTSHDFSPQPLSQAIIWPPLVEKIAHAFEGWQPPLYLVGGAVRDALLKRTPKDFDLALAGDGRRAARHLANAFQGAYFPLDDERHVGRAIITDEGQRYSIDIAEFRGGSLESDLTLRDFTLNSMAMPLNGPYDTCIDPFGGQADIRAKRLRMTTDHAIADDPIRALRGVRQSISFRLMIDPQTSKAIRADGRKLTHTSPERQRDELMRLLDGPRPHTALRAVDALGLLALLVPEVEAMRGVSQSAPHIHDVWEHTLNVVERLDRVFAVISPERTSETAADSALGMIVYLLDRYRKALQQHLANPLPDGRTSRALLMLAALLHDCGKPATRSVGSDGRIHFYQHEMIGAQMAKARAEALRLSGDEVMRLADIVRHHMRPMQLNMQTEEALSRRAVHRFWKATGPVGLDVCVLSLADWLGIRGVHYGFQDWLAYLQIVGSLLEGYLNQRDQVVEPRPLLNGNDLMSTLLIKAGPLVGQILSALAEAQAAGEISTREEAIALAKQFAENFPPA